MNNNPFQITTPEDLSAEEMVKLFVDVFSDFQKVIDPGHVFLMGPRGVGKSMMFRYLQPDCQSLKNNCDVTKLPFLGIYVPLKNTNFSMTELKRLKDRHASELLNEHILVTFFSVKIFESLLAMKQGLETINLDELIVFYHDIFLDFFWNISEEERKIEEDISVQDILRKMMNIMEKRYRNVMSYTKKLAFTMELIPFEDELFDYLDFLLPLLDGLSEIIHHGTIYLLIDDAQCLSDTQTYILNSWVSTRTSRKVSLKISAQYNYKSFYTVQGLTIDSPHDFSLIDMSSIYTGTNKSKYRNRIEEIVNKRLELYGIDANAIEFFEVDYEQENRIKEYAEKYKKAYDEGKGKGFNRSDDAIRYARPDFIKSLAGTSKNSSTYSYSGFEQLVHLSSGVVRYFLEPAHLMYAKELTNSNTPILKISSGIQNEIVREEANKFLFNELDRIKVGNHENTIPSSDIDMLTNLIKGLGALFRDILLSERSERRVFSIAISDEPSEKVNSVLELGIRLGYFQQSTIGKKNSIFGGRTKLYIMNRRLAPIWTLDPNGFAGYLFVKNELLEEALVNPDAMNKRIHKYINTDSATEYVQLSFFDNENMVDIMEATDE